MRRAAWLLAAGLAFAAPSAARASVLFDFEDQAFGADTPLTVTESGLTATFDSAGGPGSFGITSAYPLFSTLSGNILLSPGSAFVDTVPLTVTFSRAVSSLSLRFGIGTVGVTTLSFATDAGGAGSAAGSTPPRDLFAQGALSYAGPSFTSITLASAALDFAIDDLSVNLAPVTGVPAPGAAALAAGLLCLAAAARARRARSF